MRANELGVIPVLMYHRVYEGAAGDYDITPARFEAELRRLWREGYVPVRAVDLVDGAVDVPAGKSPVVLTFDDSSAEQLSYTKEGKIEPRSAIGLLLAFARAHEGFEARASIYVNGRPFNSSDYPHMLRDLYHRGFELGNHTLDHVALSSLSPDSVRRQLVLGKRVVTDVVPAAKVQTLSLPLGIWPHPRRLALAGRWNGTSYENRGILLVGSNPAPSPFDRSFDPHAIPRIRSSKHRGRGPSYGSEFWLDYLKENPGKRYVSDGASETISFPKRLRARLHPRYGERAVTYREDP